MGFNSGFKGLISSVAFWGFCEIKRVEKQGRKLVHADNIEADKYG